MSQSTEVRKTFPVRTAPPGLYQARKETYAGSVILQSLAQTHLVWYARRLRSGDQLIILFKRQVSTRCSNNGRRLLSFWFLWLCAYKSLICEFLRCRFCCSFESFSCFFILVTTHERTLACSIICFVWFYIYILQNISITFLWILNVDQYDDRIINIDEFCWVLQCFAFVSQRCW